jgi:hypothetical protein
LPRLLGVENVQPERRTGTRVFVAGDAPSVRDPGAQEEWWETPYGSWRLSAETAAMRERFPSFRLVARHDGRLGLVWGGRLRSSLSGKRYRVKIAYPWSFPDEPPTVTIEGTKFLPGTPHLLDGARPCLYWPGQGPRYGYDPGRTTAATLVSWTALWIHAYETWRATGAWPGRAE